MSDSSVDRQFGPDFQSSKSKLFRSEYALFTIAILVFVAWRYLYEQGGINIFELLFWVVFPDIAAFAPIGVASKKGTWPDWGAHVYNFFHTTLVWALVFGALWILIGAPHWELLGWLGHITADRAVGYGLRESKRTESV